MRCADCGEDKPVDAFPRNKRLKSGRHCYCKACNNRRNREPVKRLYGSSRHYHLRQKYGIGEAEVQAMIDAQGGLCAFCKRRPAEVVDHDHETGRVRAILCKPCNEGLGAFRDDPEIIRRAIAYLKAAEELGAGKKEDPC